ncbi:MAG TPA: hypothetical protein VM684_05690, partial [Gaiellales bacterium]|nr:hypothetical protein [Gaiellales bacterium]
MPVAQLDRPAQLRGDQSSGPPVVQRQPVGAEHDPGQGAVAGRPAGPGRGEDGAEAGGRRPRTGRGVDQVGRRDHHQHLRFHGAQPGQAARGQGVVGQLHQRVTELLGAAAAVPGRPVGLHEGLQGGLQLLPTDGVEFAA